jgi:preprotein translocase subunit SecF
VAGLRIPEASLTVFWRPPNFDFLRHRYIALTLSAIAVTASLASIALRGLDFGIEFTGGVLIEVAYPGDADLVDIRSTLTAAGFETAQVQTFGEASDVLIRVPPPAQGGSTEDLRDALLTALRASNPAVSLLRIESVGTQVGEDLAEQGGLALLIAFVMIFVYVMLRFRWKFAVGAIAATLHDVIVTVGFFSWLGLEFDLTVLGSVLAVLGYSLNDTIVVYDRIRDNFRYMRRGKPEAIINASVNQTLSRTFVTSLTTLLVLVALLTLGGETLAGFSIALIVGVVVGTYSTIYVATAVALLLEIAPEDFVVPSRESVDDLP